MKIYKCLHCGKESEWSVNKINKYCSNKCYNLAKVEKYRDSSTFICHTCKKSFYRVAGRKKGRKFCSPECFVIFQKEHFSNKQIVCNAKVRNSIPLNVRIGMSPQHSNEVVRSFAINQVSLDCEAAQYLHSVSLVGPRRHVD